MKNNMLPRMCRQCGTTFLGGPRAWYCPSCRKERSAKANREHKERKRAGKVTPLGSIIKCKMCGKDIVKNSGLQEYCPECAEKHLREVDNVQSLEWKKKNTEKIRECKCALRKERYANEEKRTSGVVGVSWDKGAHRWRGMINLNGKQYIIVKTKDKDIAIAARKEAELLKKQAMLTADSIENIKEKYREKKNDNI